MQYEFFKYVTYKSVNLFILRNMYLYEPSIKIHACYVSIEKTKLKSLLIFIM